MLSPVVDLFAVPRGLSSVLSSQGNIIKGICQGSKNVENKTIAENGYCSWECGGARALN